MGRCNCRRALVDFFSIRKQAKLIHAGRTEVRMKLYRKILREEWIVVLGILALWFGLGRGAAELGLIPQGGTLAWAGYGLAVAICALLLVQARTIIGKTENYDAFRKQIGWLSFLTPHTPRERRTFDLVSITAGICEEVGYRGYLIAYLTVLLGAPFWAGALLSSLIFGLAHSYQGPLGVLRTGTVGLTLALLYGMTGSLWAPMVVHLVMDVSVGRMSFAAFSGTSPERTSPEVAA